MNPPVVDGPLLIPARNSPETTQRVGFGSVEGPLDTRNLDNRLYWGSILFTRRRLRLAGSAAAVSVALILGGCSSSDTATDSGSSVSASENAYTEADSPLDKVRASFDVTTNSGALRSEISMMDMVSVGTMDSENGLALVEVEDSEIGGFKVFSDNDELFVLYSQIPEGAPAELQADTWYRVGADTQMGQMLQAMPEALRSQDRVNEIIGSSLVSAEAGESETIDGIDVTQYTATIDVEKYTDAFLAEFFADDPSAEAAREMVIAEIDPTIELWISDDGRIVRQINSGNESTNEFVEFEAPEFDRDAAPLFPAP